MLYIIKDFKIIILKFVHKDQKIDQYYQIYLKEIGEILIVLHPKTKMLAFLNNNFKGFDF